MRERFLRWVRRRAFGLTILAFACVFFVLFFWHLMVFTIPAGHAGVLFRRFFGGTVTATVRDEGLQLIVPWNTLTIYDVRLQQVEQTIPVISVDGLTVQVTLSIRYKPKINELGLLHKEIGPNYVNKIVIPEVQALVRQTFGHYTPEEMYTTKRTLIQQTLQGALGNVQERFVSLDDLLIKSIELPAMLRESIEAKLVEQQRALAMKYRIEWQKQEAKRRIIEAGGVREAQAIIGETLTRQLLEYRGIEATLKLAESPNAKVVVVGGGDNGMPLILNTGTDAYVPATDAETAGQSNFTMPGMSQNASPATPMISPPGLEPASQPSAGGTSVPIESPPSSIESSSITRDDGSEHSSEKQIEEWFQSPDVPWLRVFNFLEKDQDEARAQR